MSFLVLIKYENAATIASKNIAEDTNTSESLTCVGLIMLASEITKVLVVALPKTFPKTIFLFFVFIALSAKTSSGRFVPIAKIRTPMMNVGIFNACAIERALLTASLADTDTPMKPTKNISMLF